MASSPTPQFYIYEFSKKFDKIQPKNGIWVSGGFELEPTKAFFRSNYQTGNICEIPDEIRQAVVNGLFEIPNAYPPNPNQLGDEEFYRLVANKQLDIAHPPFENIALIARELGDYCVLAVATRQMDDRGFRAKLVGYRYFWLKTSDLNPERPDLVDGIATLLSWWLKKNPTLCFDMNPDSHENSPNKNQPYLGERVIEKSEIRTQFAPITQTNQSNRPCLFEPTTDRQFDFLALHAQALHRVQLEPAWAWNVRKLTKPETFTVVYCADRASYDQFFSPVLKPIEPSATTGSITTTSGSPNQSQQSDSSLNASLTTPSRSTSSSSPQDTSDLEKYLKDVAHNTNSPSLRSLIEFYKQKPPSKNNAWRNCVNKEVLKNPDKTLYSEADVNYLTLVSVFIWDVESQGKSGQQSTDDFSENQKKGAIGYLDALSGSISNYEEQSSYKESVSKLKRNIANLRKSLSGEDPSQGNDNLLESTLKLFRNIGGNNSSLLLIAPFVLLVFFSIIPLEMNPLKPMINKMAGVEPLPQEKIKEATPQYKVQQLQAARKFIAAQSVTKECGASGSSAKPTTQECKIYTQTKSKLPKWPELPEPPQSSTNATSGNPSPKMLARNRGKNNPSEMVSFLQQSLKVAGAEKVGDLGVFDETLENAVKEFQNKNCKETADGQVGENTWQCLSKYVQKAQVIAVLDYQIESLNQKQQASEIQQDIEQCKSQKSQPKDFLECVTGKELPK